MMVQWSVIRLFQRNVLLWVIGFTSSAYWGFEALNAMGLSPLYLPSGPLKYVTHALAMLPDGVNDLVVLVAVPLLILLSVHDLLRAPRWWSALLIWFLYTNLMNRAWLAGSGGQQLIANLLFWNIFLSGNRTTAGLDGALGWSFPAFWILRLQVLIAYLATALHKLTGTHWLDGTAMGVVATDPAFGPLWIVDQPFAASLSTWAVLLFQITFPVAVWFRRARYAWMFFGIIFHLATALWMDIPEMGLAFIAAYAIWFDEQTVQRSVPMRRLAGTAGSVSTA